MLVLQKNADKLTTIKSGLESFSKSRLFCYLAPFAVLAAYLIYIIAAGKVEFSRGYYELQYLINYDRGYCVRGFIGEIISWFADTVTPGIIRGVVNFGSVFLLVSASLCFGSVLDKTRDNPELFRAAAVIIALLCVAPFTFRYHFSGMQHDKFFWALALLAVYLTQFKKGIYAVPFVCFLATLVNLSFLLGSMFLVAIILLDKCRESGFARKNIIICAVAYLGMIGIMILGMLTTNNQGFADGYEMLDFYFSRYSEPLMPSKAENLVNGLLVEYFNDGAVDMVSKLHQMYIVNGDRDLTLFFNGVLFSVPLLIGLAVFWIAAIRAEKEKFGKFIFFLCGATLVSLIFSPFLGWSTRFYFYSYIVQIGLILYFMANKNETVTQLVCRVRNFCSEHIVASAAALSYFAIFFKNIFSI